ncbi:MAG: choice-of-anchor I family protein [Caulobacter sp.]
MRRLVAVVSLLALSASPALAVDLTPLGVYRHGGFGKSASEISTYDPASKRLFVTNSETRAIDVLDISDVEAPKSLQAFSLSAHGGGVNSVAVRDGVVAAAVDGQNPQDPGKVVFFRAADLKLLGVVEVGAMPDMLTFSPDGRYVVVADEGEPAPADMARDPDGSVAVIDVSAGYDKAVVRLAGFAAWNGVAVPGSKPVRPGATFAQGAEPEYVAISPDSRTAYVGLQEVNALAIVDLASAKVTAVRGLGFKSFATCPADVSDKDGAIAILPHPNVFGMYQPDAIAMFQAGGKSWLVSANEGDSQDLPAFSEEKRVKDLKLDPTVFPAGPATDSLARLKTTTLLGDKDGDGDLDAVYAYGGRSISIWGLDGALVADSCDAIEQQTATRGLKGFNLNNLEAGADSRSDDKGPEPEGVAVGVLDGKPYAFVGLERDGGVMIFDLSDPAHPRPTGYATTRNDDLPPTDPASGDQGPEGVLFIPAATSPNGKPLLVVSYETSGTTRIWQINE